MLIALLTATLARADDLSVVLSRTDNPTVSLVYRDVAPGRQASFTLPSATPEPPPTVGQTVRAPASMRVDIDIQPLPAASDCTDRRPQVRMSVRFIEAARGRERVVAAPVITAHVGEEANVTMGAHWPIKNPDGSTTTQESRTSLTLVYTSPVAAAPPAEAPALASE